MKAKLAFTAISDAQNPDTRLLIEGVMAAVSASAAE
jgi:hypothetical protein